MKKLLLFLLVAFIGSQIAFCQRVNGNPCIPYKKGRTFQEFKQIILTSKDPFVKDKLWPAYIGAVNEVLKPKGVSIPLNERGIIFLLNHTLEYENYFYDQDDYLNAVRIGDSLVYGNATGKPSNWGVFKYLDLSCMYTKIDCGNSQIPKPELIPFSVGLASAPDQNNINVVVNNYYNYVNIGSNKKSNCKLFAIGGVTVGFVGLGWCIFSYFKKDHHVEGSFRVEDNDIETNNKKIEL